MKILMVAPRFSPRSGGGGFVITNNLCKELSRRGHEVQVWTSDFGADAEDLVRKEFKVVSFDTAFTLMGFHISPNICTWAKWVLNKERWGADISSEYIFDIIHMQGCRTFQNIVVAYYADKYGIPYIVEAHGFPIQGTWFHKLILKTFDIMFANRIVRNACFCIAESEIGKQEYLRAGVREDKIKIIPAPYDLSIFDDLPSKNCFKSRYNIDKTASIIGFLGGLDKIKGLDYLVGAFATLSLNSKDKSTPILVLAGTDMGFKEELEVLAHHLGVRDKVVFTGYVSGREKLEFLADCNVCVFPSRAEQGLPFAALEAIMCGVPIVVSKGTGASEDVMRMGCGVVADVNHPTALGEAIEIVLGKNSFVKRGQEYIRKHLSITEAVKDYEQIYKEVIV